MIKGLGGLWQTRVVSDGEVSYYTSRAKGVLRRDEEKLLVGDEVMLTLDDATPDGIVISSLLPRRNSLIRPPLSNLDYIFIVFAAKKPQPVLETVDKLTAIAVHNRIEPVIVITKSELADSYAEELSDIYTKSGFTTFVTSSESGVGVAALSEFIKEHIRDGRCAAFAGASGVGKSTLLNALFPGLSLATGDISQKIERGKHTTRHVELYEIGEGEGAGFLADTPGFSLIDFARFDFFSLGELLPAFPDIARHSGGCRYADCAHVGEGSDECAVARAAENGEIMKTRLDSYREIYKVLKGKKVYE